MNELKNGTEPTGFECPNCGEIIPIDDAVVSIINHGFIYLDGHEHCWLGFNCPLCPAQSTYIRQYRKDLQSPILKDLFDRINAIELSKGFSAVETKKWTYCSFPYKLKKSDLLSQAIIGPETRQLYSEFESVQDIIFDPNITYVEVGKETNDNKNNAEWACSYWLGNLAMGPAIAIWWYKKNEIINLAKTESETGFKIFPRCIFYDPIYTAIGNFCWRNKLQYDFLKEETFKLPVTEILNSSTKKNLTKSLDFMHILDTVHKDDLFKHTGNKNQMTILSAKPSRLPYKNSSPIAGVLHDKFSKTVWENFTKDHIQKPLIYLADKFIDEYVELSKHIDFKYQSVWELKERYLKEIYDIVQSRYKRKIIDERSKKEELAQVKEAEKAFSTVEIISADSEINKIKILISKAPYDRFDHLSILLLGEKGTGKGLFAKAIHQASKRKGRFVRLDCGEKAETLFESGLFGHVKGAFTGADKDKKGAFEDAESGTLFFDEVGIWPKTFQSKLLGVLQDWEYQPLGSTKPKKVNALIVLATNKNLDDLVLNNQFMPDLYDRFQLPQFTIPPLRERKDDIPLLLDHFIEEFDYAIKDDSSPSPIKIDKDCIEFLKRYSWDGNVRELEKIVKNIFFTRNPKDRSPITIDDLPEELKGKKHKSTNGAEMPKTLPGNTKITDEKIQYWMKEFGNNKSHVAKELGVTYHTILRRCKKLNL